MDTITLAMLEGDNPTGEVACTKQRAAFARLWPNGAKVNLRNAKRAMRAGLDIFWLRNLLDDSARRTYDEAIAPARRAYGEARAPARRAYGEARATAIVAALLQSA